MVSVEVLAVGPWNEGEFAAAREGLSSGFPRARVDTLSAAVDWLGQAAAPLDLVLLAQPRPGFYRQEDLDRLQAAAPLTRTVVVAGSWCEGELRTGSPLHGTVRLYWYELAGWWRAAIDRLTAGAIPPWSEPLDGPAAGRWVPVDSVDATSEGGLVAIDAVDRAVYETWSDVLSLHGCDTVWFRGSNPTGDRQGFTAGIWDGGQFDAAEDGQLQEFCNQVGGPQVPVAVLLDFPRVEHHELARRAGATALFGKPYSVDEVLAALKSKSVR